MPSVILDSPSLSARTQTRFDTFLLVGRAPGVDLQILDTRVSKRHATIKLSGDGTFVVEDIGSRNGTTVNGVQITDVKELEDGAIIEAGLKSLSVIHPILIRPTQTPSHPRSNGMNPAWHFMPRPLATPIWKP